MDGNFIPIVAIGGGLGTGIIITCLALYFDHRKQVMRNQERLAAIEKGIPLPAPDKGNGGGPRHRNSLYHGIKLLFIGLGLSLALYVTVSEKFAVWGVFIVFIGLGHLVYWFIVERDRGSQESGSGAG